MDFDAVLASAVRDLPSAREFHRLFPHAEHAIVEAKRDIGGWRKVREWISRARLHDRYVVWLAVAIKITKNGVASEIEKPHVCVVEVHSVERGRAEEGGPQWECDFLQFEQDGDGWEQLVQNNGDFASVGFEMVTNAPVDRFDTFWHDTRPTRGVRPSDGMAFRAPVRFTM
jgi:hypothetical protein